MTMYSAGGHAACAATQTLSPPSLNTIPGNPTSMHAYNNFLLLCDAQVGMLLVLHQKIHALEAIAGVMGVGGAGE